MTTCPAYASGMAVEMMMMLQPSRTPAADPEPARVCVRQSSLFFVHGEEEPGRSQIGRMFRIRRVRVCVTIYCNLLARDIVAPAIRKRSRLVCN